MLFRYLELLDTDFFLFVALFGAAVLALVLGIAFHEFSHAFASDALGDPTARNLGRVSLNPLVHLDPFGTLLLFVAGFGWGKPVPVNPFALRNGPRTGMAMVAAAGPASNLVVATVLALPIRFGWVPWHSAFDIIRTTSGWEMTDYVGLVLGTGILLNVILAVFNMIPLYPLDGYNVAVGLLPIDLARPVAQLKQYGMAILMALIFLPFLVGYSPLAQVMIPAVEGIAGTLTGV